MALPESIFFPGDLQSGISFALQDSKAVACFITDDGDESSIWQNQFLKDQNVLTALTAKAIVLRVAVYSQEAQYLSAYYPIPEVPSFIIIHDGRLVLDLRAGETQSAFKAGILNSLSMAPSTCKSSSESDTESSQSLATSMALPQDRSRAENGLLDDTASTTAGPSNTLTTPESNRIHVSDIPEEAHIREQRPPIAGTRRGSAVEHLLLERRLKLDKDKEEKEKYEKSERKAKAEARQAAAISSPGSAMAKQFAFVQQRKQRQKEAKSERDRIMRQIELDKIERREREELRKPLAMAEARNAHDKYDPSPNPTKIFGRMSPSASAQILESEICALQIRLLDGSIIRKKFPRNSSLTKHVRKWVDENRPDGNAPYTFKQVLAPLPNRALSKTDEEDSLQNLGMMPSSTLILFPVQNYVTTHSAPRAYVPQALSAVYNLLISSTGVIAGSIGCFLGFNQQMSRLGEGQNEEHDDRQSNTEQVPHPAHSSVRVRTFHNQRKNQDSHQLYNGNQLNVEPQKKDKDN